MIYLFIIIKFSICLQLIAMEEEKMFQQAAAPPIFLVSKPKAAVKTIHTAKEICNVAEIIATKLDSTGIRPVVAKVIIMLY